MITISSRGRGTQPLAGEQRAGEGGHGRGIHSTLTPYLCRPRQPFSCLSFSPCQSTVRNYGLADTCPSCRMWPTAERNCVFFRGHNGPQVTRRQCSSELNLRLPRIPFASGNPHLLFTCPLCFRLLTNQGSFQLPHQRPLQVPPTGWDTAFGTFFSRDRCLTTHRVLSKQRQKHRCEASGNGQVWAGSQGVVADPWKPRPDCDLIPV